jgi:ABC-type glycerol-3-phosphate transport system permease component
MWAINSFIMVASTIILSVGVSSSAGYVFAFYTFPGKRILWVAFLFGVMVPRISFLIPQYVVLSRLGLSGEMLGVILSYVFVPTSIYLARNYFETVPKSLLESARMDGASEFRILTRIVMPLSKPILAALTTFASIGALGDYIWQMLVLQDVEKQTLMVGMIRGIMHHDGEFMINPIGRSFAAAVVLFIPVFTIFLIANRYYTGALGGAIKE